MFDFYRSVGGPGRLLRFIVFLFKLKPFNFGSYLVRFPSGAVAVPFAFNIV